MYELERRHLFSIGMNKVLCYVMMLTKAVVIYQKRIVMLAKEMEDAKASHAKRLEEEAARREDVLRSKLKQKSDQL